MTKARRVPPEVLQRFAKLFLKEIGESPELVRLYGEAVRRFRSAEALLLEQPRGGAKAIQGAQLHAAHDAMLSALERLTQGVFAILGDRLPRLVPLSEPARQALLDWSEEFLMGVLLLFAGPVDIEKLITPERGALTERVFKNLLLLLVAPFGPASIGQVLAHQDLSEEKKNAFRTLFMKDVAHLCTQLQGQLVAEIHRLDVSRREKPAARPGRARVYRLVKSAEGWELAFGKLGVVTLEEMAGLVHVQNILAREPDAWKRGVDLEDLAGAPMPLQRQDDAAGQVNEFLQRGGTVLDRPRATVRKNALQRVWKAIVEARDRLAIQDSPVVQAFARHLDGLTRKGGRVYYSPPRSWPRWQVS
jgi:hypothetical protein